MGFFKKLFEKKVCDLCGGEIGLLGNRKLEDGNMCKHCAAKLSPFFSDRRSSTVSEIKEQLAYREANLDAVKAFCVTASYGEDMKILVDENTGKFLVTEARALVEANPDVLDFSQVTGVDLEITEDESEEMRKDKDGNSVSYVPPRYTFTCDFELTIRVNHPYFDQIPIRLNASTVELNPNNPMPMHLKPKPELNREYRKYETMGEEIKKVLTEARQQVRSAAAAEAAPKVAVNCPCCGASTIPDANGCCEYCGSAVN